MQLILRLLKGPWSVLCGFIIIIICHYHFEHTHWWKPLRGLLSNITKNRSPAKKVFEVQKLACYPPCLVTDS